MIKFKLGCPRPGQWVIVDNIMIGIAVEPDHGKFRTVEDIITHIPKAERNVAHLATNLRKWRVDVVDETGFGTKQHMLLDVARLQPVTKRETIPEPRRKTLDPSWMPYP